MNQDLDKMYQGVLKGNLSINAEAFAELQAATDAEIDKLFIDRGLLKKGEKPNANE